MLYKLILPNERILGIIRDFILDIIEGKNNLFAKQYIFINLYHKKEGD